MIFIFAQCFYKILIFLLHCAPLVEAASPHLCWLVKLAGLGGRITMLVENIKAWIDQIFHIVYHFISVSIF